MPGTPQPYIKTVQNLLAEELLDLDPNYPILEQLMFIIQKLNKNHHLDLDAEDVGIAINRLLGSKAIDT